MRNYGQFCPIARGSEILAERWTPIILRKPAARLQHLPPEACTHHHGYRP
jgi:hypothetical protein